MKDALKEHARRHAPFRQLAPILKNAFNRRKVTCGRT